MPRRRPGWQCDSAVEDSPRPALRRALGAPRRPPARMQASDLVIIPWGPQKLRPASSLVVIILSADKGFGSGCAPALPAVTIVVYIRGPRPLKIIFRLWLQNLFNCLDSRTVARVEGMVYIARLFLRVEGMVYIAGFISKGRGYGLYRALHV